MNDSVTMALSLQGVTRGGSPGKLVAMCERGVCLARRHGGTGGNE